MTRMRFVYLTSAPFSGSTLFSFLANVHRQIATVGEMTGLVESSDPDAYQCSCGDKIRACSFWRRVAEKMAQRNFPFDPGFFDTRIRLGRGKIAQRVLNSSMRNTALEDLRDKMLWPTQRRRLAYLVARNKALAASILEVTGKTVFFDASKYPGVIRHLCRDVDIDLRVVHLVRDVRGASLSRRNNKRETDWRRTIRHWVLANHNIERQLQRLPPSRWLRVRYEDLCAAPSDTVARFFEFCGLGTQDIIHDFLTAEHHIVGNRMRLANFGQIRLDERWRRVLTVDDQRCAKKLAGAMQLRYGYREMSDADLDWQPTE